MLTRVWCRNQFRCYSHDGPWVSPSTLFLFCITFPTLFFPELSSQTEWCLCLKATSIDSHRKWDTRARTVGTEHFICQGALMSANRQDSVQSVLRRHMAAWRRQLLRRARRYFRCQRTYPTCFLLCEMFTRADSRYAWRKFVSYYHVFLCARL